MRVGIIGGADKNHTRYAQVACEEGCEVEFHDGRMAGTASHALRALVARCDLVVIVTDINSHNAVKAARQLSRSRNIEPLIVRRFGLNHLRDVARAHASPSIHRQAHAHVA